MKQDRFLIGILVFIVLLVITAIAIFFFRGDQQSYGPEDSPEGVVRNYALAIQVLDFERAYSYLANNSNKPDFESFRQSFLENRFDTSNTSIQIGEKHPSGKTEVLLDITVIQSYSDLFSPPYHRDEIASLTEEAQGWKIISMPYPYWGWDWYKP